jgi:hypothetical protein
MNSSLTILTVSFHSEELVRRNIELAHQLNPGVEHSWIVVDNSQISSPTWNLPKLDHVDIRILPGAPTPSQTIDGDKGSLHHATAIASAISEVNTRFLLIVDPDFFPLRNHWISDTLYSMQSNKLDFFGATWDPTQIVKYQGFPCVHFLLIDLERVDRKTLNFFPQPSRRHKMRAWMKGLYRSSQTLSMIFPWVHLGRTLLDRLASRDTGYQIFERYARSTDTRWETLEFVLDKERENLYRTRFQLAPRGCRRFLQRILYPRPLSMFFSGLETKREIVEFAPELGGKGIGWDEFWWQGAPFGVHLRRVSQTTRETCQIRYTEQSHWSLLAKLLVDFKRTQFATPVAGDQGRY